MWNFTNMLEVSTKMTWVEITCDNWWQRLCALLTQFWYWIVSGITKIAGMFADLLNIVFYIFAGIDMNSANGEVEGMYDITVVSTGAKENILDYFLFHEVVREAYWWLALIGLLAIVIFTIYKIVKQDYFEKSGPRSKGPIFRNVAISCISFLLVIPIFTLIVHVSSLLAVAVMDAMGMDASEFAGAKIFQLSWSDNGETFRYVNAYLNGTPYKEAIDSFKWMGDMNPNTLFAIEAGGEYVQYDTTILTRLGRGAWVGHIDNGFILKEGGFAASEATFYWYLYFVAIYVTIKALYDMILAMIQRIFKLMGLIIVAPSPISQYVLDDGQKYKEWLNQSIQQGLRLVVCSMSLSIFLLSLTLIRDLDFTNAVITAIDGSSGVKNPLNQKPTEGSAQQFNVTASLLVNNSLVDIAPTQMLADPVVKLSPLQKIVNVFFKIALLMASSGAMKDLDSVLSPLISGAKDSMQSGATGSEFNKVTDTAKGLAAIGVGGLASLPANMIKGGIEHRDERRKGKEETEEKIAKDQEAEKKAQEAGAVQPSGPSDAEGANSPTESGGSGGTGGSGASNKGASGPTSTGAPGNKKTKLEKKAARQNRRRGFVGGLAAVGKAGLKSVAGTAWKMTKSVTSMVTKAAFGDQIGGALCESAKQYEDIVKTEAAKSKERRDKKRGGSSAYISGAKAAQNNQLAKAMSAAEEYGKQIDDITPQLEEAATELDEANGKSQADGTIAAVATEKAVSDVLTPVELKQQDKIKQNRTAARKKIASIEKAWGSKEKIEARLKGNITPQERQAMELALMDINSAEKQIAKANSQEKVFGARRKTAAIFAGSDKESAKKLQSIGVTDNMSFAEAKKRVMAAEGDDMDDIKKAFNSLGASTMYNKKTMKEARAANTVARESESKQQQAQQKYDTLQHKAQDSYQGYANSRALAEKMAKGRAQYSRRKVISKGDTKKLGEDIAKTRTARLENVGPKSLDQSLADYMDAQAAATTTAHTNFDKFVTSHGNAEIEVPAAGGGTTRTTIAQYMRDNPNDINNGKLRKLLAKDENKAILTSGGRDSLVHKGTQEKNEEAYDEMMSKLDTYTSTKAYEDRGTKAIQRYAKTNASNEKRLTTIKKEYEGIVADNAMLDEVISSGGSTTKITKESIKAMTNAGISEADINKAVASKDNERLAAYASRAKDLNDVKMTTYSSQVQRITQDNERNTANMQQIINSINTGLNSAKQNAPTNKQTNNNNVQNNVTNNYYNNGGSGTTQGANNNGASGVSSKQIEEFNREIEKLNADGKKDEMHHKLQEDGMKRIEEALSEMKGINSATLSRVNRANDKLDQNGG